MKKLYKDGMVSTKGRAKPSYTALRRLAKHNICPLCSQNSVSTLDHYLPQSRFSTLVVAPENLIPACADCNRYKLARVFKSMGEQTFHPYFDDFTAEQWLFAKVVESSPCALEFFLAPSDNWSADEALRITAHFKTFKLGSLYVSNAANELNNIRHGLEELHEQGGTEEVRRDLSRRARSNFSAYKNSWQTAMFQTLAASDWFCNGGFRGI